MNASSADWALLDSRVRTYANQRYSKIDNDFLLNGVLIKIKYRVPSITRVK